MSHGSFVFIKEYIGININFLVMCSCTASVFNIWYQIFIFHMPRKNSSERRDSFSHGSIDCTEV